jgi:hypothetical protein
VAKTRSGVDLLSTARRPNVGQELTTLLDPGCAGRAVNTSPKPL